MKSTLYFREKGSICYEAELFSDEEELTSLIQTLLSMDLSWYWASDRQYEAIEEYKAWNLPKSRPLTRLTNETSKSLYQDFLEEDTDMRRRSIDLYCVKSDRSITTHNDLRQAIKEFLSDSSSIVHCVVIQINDTVPQYIFVPHKPNDAVQGLLDKWELRRETAQSIRNYKQLYSAQLENMIESFFATA